MKLSITDKSGLMVYGGADLVRVDAIRYVHGALAQASLSSPYPEIKVYARSRPTCRGLLDDILVAERKTVRNSLAVTKSG